MPQQYLPQDVIDEAREAHRLGVPLGSLASKLGIEPDELARLLGLLPAWEANSAGAE